jgi:hypothetical protein
MAARDGSDSGEGEVGVGLDQARGLVEEVAKRLAEGIWMGWRKHGEFQREKCGGGSVLGGREGEDRAMRLKEREARLSL